MQLEEVLKTTKENKQIAPVSGASCKLLFNNFEHYYYNNFLGEKPMATNAYKGLLLKARLAERKLLQEKEMQTVTQKALKCGDYGSV